MCERGHSARLDETIYSILSTQIVHEALPKKSVGNRSRRQMASPELSQGLKLPRVHVLYVLA